ncbi:MAG: hypothetical protein QXG91_00980 [Candidatus Aenigmatarchaeota archaeon]
MKGYVEEIFYFLIVFFSILLLFIFFNYQLSTKGIETRKTVEERNLVESITTLFFELFNNKLPYVEKVYMQLMIDALLQKLKGLPEEYKVFYGTGIGTLNLTEIIPPFLDKYAKNRYQLYLIIPAEKEEKKFFYGKEIRNEDILYVYETVVPVPDLRIGKVVLYISKP